MRISQKNRINNKNRYKRVQELKEEFDNVTNMKKKKLLRKINNIANRIVIIETKKQNKIDAYINRECDRRMRVLENNEQMKKDDNDYRHFILEYQREMVGRGLMKDNLVILKRNNAMYYSSIILYIEVLQCKTI